MNKQIPNIGAAIVAVLFALPAGVHAQYQNKSPAEILREAQERQRAIDQAGRDLQRNLSKILEEEQAQEARERQLRQEEQQARRQEEQARRDRQAEQERQRQAESQQRLQEAARRQQESVRNNETLVQRPVLSKQPGTPAGTVPAGALAGSPNDEGARKEGWSQWQLVSDNIWVSFCQVKKGSYPLWTWAFRNWSDREVKTIWIEYWSGDKWNKDREPVHLKPRAFHGGWATFTAEGPTPPSIRVTGVDYK